MLYLTLIQNSGGRSGHKLKDIMTVFIISYFIEGSVVVRNYSWNNQYILGHIKRPYMKSLIYDETHEIKIDNFHGISNDQFFENIEFIKKKNIDNKNILIVLSGAFRFHPFQLHNLFLEKKIERDYFTNNFLPTVKNFFFGKNRPDKPTNSVAIHIRRGDIGERLIKNGQNSNYYGNIIKKLNSNFNIPINIYSENLNSKDLFALKKEPNVTLHLGTTASIKKDMYEMVTSKYLIISSGGFSTISAYISIGTVLYNSRFCWHFGHKEPPKNMYNFKLKTLQSIFDDMKNKVKQATAEEESRVREVTKPNIPPFGGQ
jgi:hypothetical protein